MSDVLYLAWRYLAGHAAKTVLLTASLTLVLYTPLGLRTLVRTGERQLHDRAAATPLLLGAQGSPLELALNALYFRAETPEPLVHGVVADLRGSGLGVGIPLHVRFRVGEWPVVGTSLDYFPFRGLEFAEGRPLLRLGECVLGAAAARGLGEGPGGAVISSPESIFDLAGVYPLKMRVVGVLAPTGTPDDRAVFVDIKTAWVIQGLAHGHADLADPAAAGGVLAERDGRIVANESVLQFNEITEENRDSFHLHGDPAELPLTGVVVVPEDERAATLLLGRYQDDAAGLQLLRPSAVMDELFATVFRVEGFVLAALIGVGAATLAIASLVFLLSLRLRRREFLTLRRIGAQPWRATALWCSEMVSVTAAAVVLALLLDRLTAIGAAPAVEWLLGRA